MEIELNIPTQLFGGPPVLDDVVKMGESQIGFMNIFARPLFEAVAHILPAMQFSVDEIITNKNVWEQKIAKEKDCQNHDHVDGICVVQSHDGMASPLSGSQEELPGTKPLSTSLTADIQSQEETRGDSDSTPPVPALTSTQPFGSQEERVGLPGERKKKEKNSGSRLRSLSPTKRKTKSNRSSSKQEATRPRTSPASSGNGAPIPPSHSQPDVRYSQMNGHTIPSTNDGAVEKPNSYLVSNSTTDVSSGGHSKNRTSKFGFGKLWKKRWRTASASQSQKSPRVEDDQSTTEGR
jgi:hypothetical protein